MGDADPTGGAIIKTPAAKATYDIYGLVTCALAQNDLRKACWPIKAGAYNIEQHLDKLHGKYEAPAAAAQLTLEQTLLRGQQQAARAQLSAADAANWCAVAVSLPTACRRSNSPSCSRWSGCLHSF